VLTTRGAFLAAWGVGIRITASIARRPGAALFGGAGLVLQRVDGRGIALVHGRGDFRTVTLAGGEALHVSTGNLAAFSDTIDYDVESVGSLRNGCSAPAWSSAESPCAPSTRAARRVPRTPSATPRAAFGSYRLTESSTAKEVRDLVRFGGRGRLHGTGANRGWPRLRAQVGRGPSETFSVEPFAVQSSAPGLIRPTIALQSDLSAVLREGRVLGGEVLQTLDGETLLIGVGRHRVPARTKVRMQEGHRFLFQVQLEHGEVVLRVLGDAGEQDSALLQALRRVVGQDAPVGELLQRLAAARRGPATGGPGPLRNQCLQGPGLEEDPFRPGARPPHRRAPPICKI
jgi:hypothetical protein